ncbi:MAG: DUF2203 domain-containing protein [Blastocatellia bacterium]|nr:DUF2203 domain-containing protein [Blastocatellia bacterium]
MKLFTVEEANDLLPRMRLKLGMIKELYTTIDGYRESAKAAAAASEFGGGMVGGGEYVDSLYNVGKLTTEIIRAGVQLKDHQTGLIDFPSMRGGRVVLLCWKLGEGDSIEWWHESEAGFAGRQPL